MDISFCETAPLYLIIYCTVIVFIMKYKIKEGMFSQTLNFVVVFVSGWRLKNKVMYALDMYSLNCSKTQ
jgi:hypothetical protein